MSSFIENLFGLTGRVAAVTGGGGHVCGEMARGLAQAGCKVAVMDIRLAKAQDVALQISQEYGGEAIGVEVDASDKASFQEGLEATLAAFNGWPWCIFRCSFPFYHKKSS